MKPFDNENIVLFDNHLLVVDKPAGIATQPDLVELGKAWLKKRFHKPGNVFLEPIHRLDKPVAGIVLFARTTKALSRLQQQMRSRQMEKIYHAWVEGVPNPPQGILRHHLVHGSFRALVLCKLNFDPLQRALRSRNRKDFHVDSKDQNLVYRAPVAQEGKEAVLEYEVLKQEKGASYLQIRLHTGRYHQIRAQMGAIGCPIIGDEKYGSRKNWRKGIALFASELKFKHPVTQGDISVKSRLGVFFQVIPNFRAISAI